MNIPQLKHPIHAIYSNGQLRLLDPVELTEGQEIQFVIVSERERLRAALQDGFAEPLVSPNMPFDEEIALMREVEQAFQGQPALSEAIIEERREGP